MKPSLRSLATALVAAGAFGSACTTTDPCRPGTVRLVITCGAESAGIDGVSISLFDHDTPSVRKDGIAVPIHCPGQASLEVDLTDYRAGRVLGGSLTPVVGDAGAGATQTLSPITLGAGCTAATVGLGSSDGSVADVGGDGSSVDGPAPPDGKDGDGKDGPPLDRPQSTDGSDGGTATDGSDGGPPADGPGTVGGNGTACTANNQCASNACVDGVCCNSSCAGTCSSCLGKNTGGMDGECDAVTVGTDPDNECADTPASGCGLEGSCDGAGACRMWGTTTVCGAAAQCSGGQFSPASHCDSHGVCTASTIVNCSGYGCALPDGCKTTCGSDADCVGVSCVNGSCGGKKPTGATCTTGSDCALGYCVSGVCCGSACTQACMACGITRTGKPDGQCQPATAGSDPNDDCTATAASGCMTTGDCDGAGHCALYGATTTCGTESCAGTTHTPLGTCSGQGSCQTPATESCGLYSCGTSSCHPTCASDTDCAPTVAYCAGTSCAAKKINGTTCGAARECQSNFCVDGYCCNSGCTAGCYSCNGTDTGRASGQCQAVTDGTSDGTCGTQAPSSCGTTGACNGAGACKLYASGTACGNAESCTGSTHTPAGSCSGSGTCTAGQPAECSPYGCSGGRCTTSCTTDTDCAAQSACTGGKCSKLVCSSGGWCWYNPRPFGGTLGGVWGTSSTSVWAVGAGGAIAHWDGSVWNGFPEVPGVDFNDVAGSADGTAFAVGSGGTIVQWDGFSWRQVASGTSQMLVDVWMTQPNDGWAVGGALLHWNGSEWSSVTTPGAPVSGSAVWASGASDVYVAGPDALYHWNGSVWATTTGPWEPGAPILGVVGSGPSELWVEASELPQSEQFCDLYHWDGQTWTNVDSTIFCEAPKLSSPVAGEVWFTDIGNGTFIWKNGALSVPTDLTGSTAGVVFARTSTDAWVGFQHWGGTTFSNTVTSFGNDYGAAVKVISPTEVWIAGQNDSFVGTVYAWRGSGFVSESPTGIKRLRGIWADSSTDIWIAGEGPFAGQSTGGSTWGNGGGGSTANDYLYGVSGTSVIDVWFVGSKGRIWHSNGSGLNTTIASGVTDDLLDVAAIAANDAWIVGASGRILHGGSQGWSPSTSGTTQFLYGVCANSTNDVWAVGGNGVALHFGGAGWSAASSGTGTTPFNHIWCASPTEMWAVGYYGAIYQGNGSTWTASASGTQAVLSGVSGTTHAIWATGSGGTVLVKSR